MQRSGGILGVPLLLAVALAVGLVFVLEGPEGRPAVAAASSSADALHGPVSRAHHGQAAALQDPAPGDAPRAEAPTCDRIQAALAELVPMLDAPELLRTRWELTSRALAKYVGPKAGPELLARVSDPATSPPDRIAAGELLRRVFPRAEVPAPALAGLRQAAFGGLPDSAQASASRRVLAGLGDWSDRLRLVGELEAAASLEVAIAASWSLRASRTHDVLPDLRRLIQASTEPRTSELAVLSTESIVRSTDPLKRELRDSLTHTIVSAVAAQPELSNRAAGLLGALGGPRAQRVLAELARTEEAGGPAAQALAETEGGRRTLTDLLGDVSTTEGSRLAAATALARGSEDGGDHRRAALDGLRRLAREGDRAEHRRQAVLALAEYAPDAATAIEGAMLEDPDASVRATAVVASARLEDPEAARAALSACVAGDESPGVRELASRFLAGSSVTAGE